MPDTTSVELALQRLIAFLQATPGGATADWAARLARIEREMQVPDRRGQALAELMSWFEGEPSLNDVWFSPLNRNVPPGANQSELNREFARLLGRLYRELALNGASWWTRLYWEVWKRNQRGGPPPRGSGPNQ
jgi:hypothetical protein